MNRHKLIFLPLVLLSTIAIIHNAYLAKETAALHTGYAFFDWLLAVTFAIGIESGLWVLIIHRKKQAVQAYALILFALNVLYYGRDGKLNQIINMMHPETWTYIEGILACLIFSALLSGFAWFLSEIAIEQLFKNSDKEPFIDKGAYSKMDSKHSIVCRSVEAPSLALTKQWSDAPVTDKLPVITTETVPEEPVTAIALQIRDRVCPNCGNSLEMKRKNAIYCNDNCKQANYRKSLKKEAA